MTEDIIDQLSYYVTNEMRMPAGLTTTVINHIEAQKAEIERLQGEVEGWREAVDYCHSIIEMLRRQLAEHRLPSNSGDNTISNQTS
jgi:hypothetical protein